MANDKYTYTGDIESDIISNVVELNTHFFNRFDKFRINAGFLDIKKILTPLHAAVDEYVNNIDPGMNFEQKKLLWNNTLESTLRSLENTHRDFGWEDADLVAAAARRQRSYSDLALSLNKLKAAFDKQHFGEDPKSEDYQKAWDTILKEVGVKLNDNTLNQYVSINASAVNEWIKDKTDALEKQNTAQTISPEQAESAFVHWARHLAKVNGLTDEEGKIFAEMQLQEANDRKEDLAQAAERLKHAVEEAKKSPVPFFHVINQPQIDADPHYAKLWEIIRDNLDHLRNAPDVRFTDPYNEHPDFTHAPTNAAISAILQRKKDDADRQVEPEGIFGFGHIFESREDGGNRIFNTRMQAAEANRAMEQYHSFMAHLNSYNEQQPLLNAIKARQAEGQRVSNTPEAQQNQQVLERTYGSRRDAVAAIQENKGPNGESLEEYAQRYPEAAGKIAEALRMEAQGHELLARRVGTGLSDPGTLTPADEKERKAMREAAITLKQSAPESGKDQDTQYARTQVNLDEEKEKARAEWQKASDKLKEAYNKYDAAHMRSQRVLVDHERNSTEYKAALTEENAASGNYDKLKKEYDAVNALYKTVAKKSDDHHRREEQRDADKTIEKTYRREEEIAQKNADKSAVSNDTIGADSLTAFIKEHGEDELRKAGIKIEADHTITLDKNNRAILDSLIEKKLAAAQSEFDAACKDAGSNGNIILDYALSTNPVKAIKEGFKSGADSFGETGNPVTAAHAALAGGMSAVHSPKSEKVWQTAKILETLAQARTQLAGTYPDKHTNEISGYENAVTYAVNAQNGKLTRTTTTHYFLTSVEQNERDSANNALAQQAKDAAKGARQVTLDDNYDAPNGTDVAAANTKTKQRSQNRSQT